MPKTWLPPGSEPVPVPVPGEPAQLQTDQDVGCNVRVVPLREYAEEQLGHGPAAEEKPASDEDLLRDLIGTLPDCPPCSRPWAAHVRGRPGTETDGVEGVIQLRCRNWSCQCCRTRARHLLKQEHAPRVHRGCTHIWRGIDSQWENLRKRLDRAGVEYRYFRVIESAAYSTFFIAVTSGAEGVEVSDDSGIEAVRGLEAVERFVAAVDAIPDSLPAGTKKHSCSKNWKLALPADPPCTENCGQRRPLSQFTIVGKLSFFFSFDDFVSLVNHIDREQQRNDPDGDHRARRGVLNPHAGLCVRRGVRNDPNDAIIDAIFWQSGNLDAGDTRIENMLRGPELDDCTEPSSRRSSSSATRRPEPVTDEIPW